MEKKFRVHEVVNTPFCIAENEGKFCVVMGQYKVSNDYTTKEEAENYIKKKPWELITVVMGIISEKVLNDINNQLKTK